MSRVYVFLADGFEEIEGLTVVDILRRAGVDTTTVSIMERRNVMGSHKIPVTADACFDEVDFSEGELLVLPGGMPGSKYLAEHKALGALLKDYAEHGRKVAAICAAPGVLGGLGILKGKKAVCYPGFEEQLKGSIEPGKLADFVVIDRDYMKCPEEEIKDICSLQTVVGGEVVYETK